MINDFVNLDNKVRIRSKEELEKRKQEFLIICNILDKLGITYFLQTGVLLGAIRHNDFIPWDWDVEFSVYPSEMISKIDALISEIESNNFSIVKCDKNLTSVKLDFVGKLPIETTSYTIFGWNHDVEKKIFWRKTYKVPDHFIINMKKIKFFDRYHYAPFPPEKYLEYHYGDWKKPLQTSNKNIYMRKEYSGNNLLKNIFEKIENITKRFLLNLFKKK